MQAAAERAAPPDRSERARARVGTRDQRAAGTRIAAALDRERPAPPRVTDASRADESSAGRSRLAIAAIGVALTILVGGALVLSNRRRPDEPEPTVALPRPSPPAPDAGAEIEAALQEILAEEEAARALSRPAARH